MPRLTDRRKKLRQTLKHKIDFADLAVRLPGEVTAVVPQKNHADRVSLFVEGEFLAGISIYTREKIPIGVGDIITAEQIKSMLEWDEYPRVKNKLIEYLARRPHSKLELRQKVTRKGFTGSVVDEVIESLSASGYVNDQEFACSFARDKFDFNKWGPNRIKAALMQKGVEGKWIDMALEKTIETEKLQQQIRHLLLKKVQIVKKETDIYKKRKKVYDFLLRKGYRHNDVIKVIESEKL